MSRKQSSVRKELHRTHENASKARTDARKAARSTKHQTTIRFGTENMK